MEFLKFEKIQHAFGIFPILADLCHIRPYILSHLVEDQVDEGVAKNRPDS